MGGVESIIRKKMNAVLQLQYGLKKMHSFFSQQPLKQPLKTEVKNRSNKTKEIKNEGKKTRQQKMKDTKKRRYPKTKVIIFFQKTHLQGAFSGSIFGVWFLGLVYEVVGGHKTIALKNEPLKPNPYKINDRFTSPREWVITQTDIKI